ncbi:MAG: efflux RND transporter periplasmic adaptor subunit [Gemmatimonadetes bacterium]|nr:efflux RND transporter periplasmic adaptor subunit [Gemmatimonadota bacterium]
MRYANPVLRLARLLAIVLIAGCQDEVEPPMYQIVPVVQRSITVSVRAEGVIEPIQTIEVKSKASGEIMEVLAETGDLVHRGNLLVRVDPRGPRNGVVQAEADIAVAEAQLTNAESELRRAEALYETQSMTEREYDQARLARANANAQLIRARRSLQDATIAFEDTDVRAPATGVILVRSVEVGTVISSATGGVNAGSVLMSMANLETVQIRSLVPENDIGKVRAGMDATITVDAYPDHPFSGQVLKIEPQAVESQNETLFPVLIRIPNEGNLLRPGMNTDVEIHVGSQDRVLTVPNAALRTERDLQSAAMVLGLDMAVVRAQLAAARGETAGRTRSGQAGGTVQESDNTVTFNGRTVPVPAGLTKEQVQPVLDKLGQGGGPATFQSLSAEERSIMQRVMGSLRGNGGRRRGEGQRGFGGEGDRGDRRRSSTSAFQFGGDYIVFVMRDTGPAAVPIRTGMTDLDYAEVASGLTGDDRVLILPSASLVQNQQEFQERMRRFSGGLPGLGGRR